jgi:uncharacterized phage-associated protein
MIISLIEPDVIVTLGAMALNALALLSMHGIELQDGVAQVVPWRNARLLPLYHPGPRALVHRSLAKQRSDFMRLSKIVHPVNGLIEHKSTRTKVPSLSPSGPSPMQQVALALVQLGGRMTYFKLTKLMYFVDHCCMQRFGHALASNIYLRQVDGPWPPKLNEALKAMEHYEVRRSFVRGIPTVAIGPSPRFDVQLDDNSLEVISEVFRIYGSMSNREIKAAVCRTDPMQIILQEEMKGKKMINKPVLYNDESVQTRLSERGKKFSPDLS